MTSDEWYTDVCDSYMVMPKLLPPRPVSRASVSVSATEMSRLLRLLCRSSRDESDLGCGFLVTFLGFVVAWLASFVLSGPNGLVLVIPFLSFRVCTVPKGLVFVEEKEWVIVTDARDCVCLDRCVNNGWMGLRKARFLFKY